MEMGEEDAPQVLGRWTPLILTIVPRDLTIETRQRRGADSAKYDQKTRYEMSSPILRSYFFSLQAGSMDGEGWKE
jgi:hypothetical protein